VLAVAVTVLILLGLAALVVGPRLLNRGEMDVLVLGLDNTPAHLADTILFVHADSANAKVALLAVPRDTWLPGREGRGNKANALLREPEGLGQLARSLHLAVPPHRVTVTSEYLPALVSAVGGVDVEVGPSALNGYDKAGKWHIHVPAGRQHLEGEQAFGYARFRKPRRGPCPFCGATWPPGQAGDGSDLARLARQQKLVRAVLAKLHGAGLFWRSPRLLWTAAQARSNLTFWQRLALISCLRRAGAPELAVYPTRLAGPRLLPAPEATGRLGGELASLLAGRVVVRNGAGSPGLATRVASALAHKGFLVASPENAPRAVHTRIEGPAELGRQVQQALGYGACAYRGSKDVVVTIGLDAPNLE
jgi:hypothetical protein